MRRGTTPTISLVVDADLTEWECYVTLNNGGNQLTFENERQTKTLDDGKTTIEVTLTQEETLSLVIGRADIQIRAYNAGAAVATNIASLPVDRILLGGVIPNA